METKICSSCGKELPITSFYTWGRKDGSVGSLHQCLKCQRHKAYERHYKKHKKKSQNILSKIETEVLIEELKNRGAIIDKSVLNI